jgi:hypothetical protein
MDETVWRDAIPMTLPADSVLWPTLTAPDDHEILCVERFDSRQWNRSRDPTVTLIYTLWRSEDELRIASKLENTAPAIYEGLDADSYNLDPQGGGVWTASVLYKIRNPSAETFDTTGGSVHITQSYATQRFGLLAPDFQGAIGVGENKVEGVDITIPAFKFTETHYVPRIFVNATYKNTLFQLTGKVNNGPFKGFAAGEVLFLGSTGQRRGLEDFEITYNFVASPNVASITFTPGLTVINKEGWDYLWLYYADDVDQTAHRIVRRPKAAYVERVYPRADLSLLGLGA